MSFPYGSNLYGIGVGTKPESVEVPVIQGRAPSTTDTRYLIGKVWVDNVNNAAYILTSFSSALGILSANWEVMAAASGDISAVVGTANQVTVTTSGDTATVSLPSAITTPGSLTTTTTLASGTTLTAGTSASVTTSLTVGTTITATLGAITATHGNLVATNGNLVLGTAGNKIDIATGTNASCGVTADMSGTPGAVSVSTTACTASSVILFSRATTGGTPGEVSITAQSTSGFTLTSTGNETSTFNYLIIN